jgi:ribosome-binding protein aMBF1 (putative translation factor)
MGMEECDICGAPGNEVRLFDGIHEGRMSQVCERCSIIENIPIIKKPDNMQLKESEKGARVLDRMKLLVGMKDGKEEETFFPEDKLKELDRNPELEKPEQEKLNLISHYHWEIMKHRRRRGLTQEKLAHILGESEIAIQLIEKGKLPENAGVLIKKLEQYFQTRLRKISETELFQMRKMRQAEREKPVLLDESGRELETIPEPEIKKPEIQEEELEEETAEQFLERGEEWQEKGEVEEKEELEEEKKETQVECRTEEFDESKKKMICEQVPVEEQGEREVEETEREEEQEGSVKDFDLKRVDLSSVTINDLRRLHRKKIQATKQEQLEEQRKIEERQRLIEARKEESRLRKEKQSQELDEKLGGTELLK